jgi:hypothetical protein
MKIKNIKVEVTKDMETSEKRIKLKQKKKNSGCPLWQTRANTRQNFRTQR